MMHITPEIAVEISKKLGRALYCANPFWLVENGFYEEIDGETIVYVHDRADDKTYLLFTPTNLLLAKNKHIECATETDIKKLQTAGLVIKKEIYWEEYFYRTQDLIEMNGHEWASFRKRVRQFVKNHKFRLLSEYKEKDVVEFIHTWAEKKDTSKFTPETKAIFDWDLDNSLNYPSLAKQLPCKNLFVEIDGTLAGFAMTCPLAANCFTALCQKVDTSFSGISRFLYHEKSKLWNSTEQFTCGATGGAKGLHTFKEELKPYRKENIHFVCCT